MTDNELKRIREKVSCPQFGDDHYGEWGALNLNQRREIKRMLDHIDIEKAGNKYLQDLLVKNNNEIAKQEAEIERLEKEVTALMNDNNIKSANLEWVQKLMSATDKVITEAKSEAYKEFAERLKEKYGYYDWENKTIVYPKDEIDSLLKELVGDDNPHNIDKQN